MVRRQCNINIELLGNTVNVLGKGDGAESHVFCRAADVLGAAGAHLDDAVGLRLRKGGERGVRGVRARHVDAGERVVSSLRGVEKAGELLGRRDGHRKLGYRQRRERPFEGIVRS